MNRDPSRLGDKIIFWVCLISTAGLIVSAIHDHGVEQGKATCRPTVLIPKVMSYPKTKAEMQRFLKTREAAGGVR
jgi:hypothetical protein